MPEPTPETLADAAHDADRAATAARDAAILLRGHGDLQAGVSLRAQDALAQAITHARDAIHTLTRTEATTVAGLLAAARADYARHGRAIGSGEGDTTPVYLHVQERADMVIPIERTTFEDTSKTLAELVGDRIADHRRTIYTSLALGDEGAPDA